MCSFHDIVNNTTTRDDRMQTNLNSLCPPMLKMHQKRWHHWSRSHHKTLHLWGPSWTRSSGFPFSVNYSVLCCCKHHGQNKTLLPAYNEMLLNILQYIEQVPITEWIQSVSYAEVLWHHEVPFSICSRFFLKPRLHKALVSCGWDTRYPQSLSLHCLQARAKHPILSYKSCTHTPGPFPVSFSSIISVTIWCPCHFALHPACLHPMEGTYMGGRAWYDLFILCTCQGDSINI